MVDQYQQELLAEREYLAKVLTFLKKEITLGEESLRDQKNRLIASKKELWVDNTHFNKDINTFSEISSQSVNYENTCQVIEYYKKALDRPYFGRFDFVESGTDERENIYIGLHNVIDSKTHDIYVYDWRAPVSSIFYRFEPGQASYTAPVGTISGDVLLKRQYKIKNTELKYFFDCSLRITDEILQEVLHHNSSGKMKNIVESIQKEQDTIIRDTANELLIVQGVAGSGKTSVALHRIAFLLYEGLDAKLNFNNIIIISPNAVFSKYISRVLPELGEENVVQSTFDDITKELINDRLKNESRNKQLESLISSQGSVGFLIKKQSIEFKGSPVFSQILDKLIRYYELEMIKFEDIYYNGIVLYTKQQLKNLFLNDKTGLPMAKRLKWMENMILNKVHPLQKKRLGKIEKIVQNTEGREFEFKPVSRLLSIKFSKAFLQRIQKFTEVDFVNLYSLLFNEQGLLLKLGQGSELPTDLEKIVAITRSNLEKGVVDYEDCAPLLYLKLKMEGNDLFPEVKQVVVDEAQDYYPMHYEVLKLLFNDAKYTLLGDNNQAIEKTAQSNLFDAATEILDKRKTVKIFLNKSYRSTYEINSFTQKLKGGKQDSISFERHDSEPLVVYKDSVKKMEQAIIQDIFDFLRQGYESIALITKTATEAKILYDQINAKVKIKLVASAAAEIEKGAIVIPSYLAKGLEFDAVIVYDVSNDNYTTELDQKLLYIACTRALHRLIIYFTGEKSELFNYKE